MSINAVKGVEIGDGFEVKLRGSENRDEITKAGFQSNHAGGILGGISSGQQIVANIALKPTSSITVPGHTINRFGEEVEMITKGVTIRASASAPYRSLRRCWRSF